MLYINAFFNCIGMILLVIGCIYAPIALRLTGQIMINKLKDKIKAK